MIVLLSYSHRAFIVFSSYFDGVNLWAVLLLCGGPTEARPALNSVGWAASPPESPFFKYPNPPRIGFSNES